MLTNNLSRVEMTQTQTNRYVNVNEQTGTIDAAVTAVVDIPISTVTPISLTTAQATQTMFFVLEPDVSPPIAPFVVLFPDVDRGLVYIHNNTTQLAAIAIVGQATPPSLPAGVKGLFIISSLANGDGVRSIITGSAGASTFTGLSDVPGSYIGHGSKLVSVNAAETALEFITTLGRAIRAFSGTVANPGFEIGESGTGFSLPTAGKPSFSIGGVESHRETSIGVALGAGYDPTQAFHIRRTGATGATILNEGEGATQLQVWRSSTDASSGALNFRKSRGTIAARTYPNQNDATARILAQISDASNNNSIYDLIISAIATTPNASNVDGREVLSLGTGSTLSEIRRFDHATGFSMYGTNPVIDNNLIHRLPSFTKATLPAVVRGVLLCSDEDGGAQPLYGDTVASQWKRFRDGKQSGTTPRGESFVIAASDESTALTTGNGKIKFRIPYAFTLTEVRASLSTAQTSGSIFTVDINEAGATILSTKITIDNGETTSTTAATPPVISDTSLADDAELSVDIDQVGDGTAKGLKVVLIGRQT